MIGATSPRIGAVRHFYLARFARIYPLHLFTLLAMVAVELSTYAFRPQIADAFVNDHKDWGSIHAITHNFNTCP